MAVGDQQRLITEILAEVLNEKAETNISFEWLKNKHLELDFKNEKLGINLFPVVENIFAKLKGDKNGMASKGARVLKPDCYFGGKYNFIFEFDELQHFTAYKMVALQNYPSDLKYGFDIKQYLLYCNIHKDKAIKKGPPGYRKPKEEFPFENGRAAQRAFFDSFRDLLPTLHGLNPTLRISEFEAAEIHVNNEQAKEKIRQILINRGIL